MLLNKLSVNALVALLCVVLNAQGSVAASEMLFFQPSAMNAKGMATPQSDSLPAGIMEVALNLDIFLLEPGSSISLNLPDATYRVVFDRVIVHKSGNKTWVGHLENFPDYRVMLTGSASVYSGRIATPDKIYAIRHQQGKTVLVDYKAAGMTHVPLGEDAMVPPRPEVEGDMPEQLNAPATQMDAGNTNTIIDLMILYSPGVASDFPGPALQIEIDRLTAIANQAYADSGITTTLRVIKTQPSNYADFGGNSDAHNDLTNNSGEFSGIGASRDLAGADLVILLRKYANDSGSCGMAWRLAAADFSSPSYFADNYAYAVVSLGSFSTGPYSSAYCSDSSYPHEIGHLMGSKHDRNLDSNGGVFDYALGHYDGGLFGTIMSYEKPGVLYFSNPDLMACGNPVQACGIAVGQFGEADNRTAFNQTNPVLAGFRIAAANGFDDHGDSMATATPVASTSLTNGSLEVEGDIDYFRVDVPLRGLLVVNTQGDTDTYGTLLDATGAIVAQNDDTVGVNFELIETVEAGTYYIVVEGYSGYSTGDYTLKSTFLGRPNALKITAGVYHSCALDDSGVVCWGSDWYGQSSVPALSNPTQVTAGDFHSCALDDSGVVCWGDDWYGQSSVPILSNPTQVTAGYSHSCALDDSGVVCWGDNNDGQSSAPVLSNPTQVTAGYYHSCAVDDSGVVCWGSDGSGQSSVPSLSNPTQVTAGGWHSCALDDSGVVCWGYDWHGQSSPPMLSNPTQVTAGSFHSCAIDDSGVICWGDDIKGQSSVPSLSNPSQVTAGELHSCAVDDRGVVCWGGDVFGQSSVPNTLTTGVLSDDFNGDGKADILTRHSTTGELYLDEMDGNIRTGSSIGGLSTVWSVAGLGDFGGDGKSDILLRLNFDGQLYLYEMDGNSRTGSSIGALSPAWAVAGIGDFGGDGKADILIRHTASGQLYLFEMDGNQKTGSNIGDLSLSWDVVGIGDFGGDGKADILLRNSNTGQLYLFEMDGNQKTGSNIGGLSLGWGVVGTGDLGGDGKDDIVIRNVNTGQLYLYEMDGNARIGSNIGMLALGWEVARIADYGGDGKADILLRNRNNGQLYLYEMDGSAITSSNIGGLSNSWEVQVQ